jgi:hypothetical protein
MKSTTTIPFILLLAVMLLGAACSRELPSQWPTSSPASPSAAELPPAAVTLAVDDDPPLPGEAADGWFGLDRPATSNGHQHGGHQGAGHDH